MVNRFGAAPLYNGDVYAAGTTAPGVSILLTVEDRDDRLPGVTEDAKRLRDHLLTLSTPWIDGEQWWSQLATADAWLERWMAQRLYVPWPDGEDRGTFAVLCLPWLESAHRLRDQAFGPEAAALVLARAGSLDPAVLDELPESCRGYIAEWIGGRSVIGPPTSFGGPS